MKNIFICIISFYFLSCNNSNNYLKDNYSKGFSLSDMQKADTIVNYFTDKSECDSIIFKSLTFTISHERKKTLNNLYLNIYIEQKKIFSGTYSDKIITNPINLCYNKKSGNFIWFSAYDTINKVYYSWGQKNSVPILDDYKIKLLQKEDNDENNFIIENW